MHDLGWRSGQSPEPAPGPSVHHDETHGYHTADGEPVESSMERLNLGCGSDAWWMEVSGHAGEDATVGMTIEYRDKLFAEIGRLEGERDGACHHINLQIKRAEKAEAQNTRLRRALERVRTPHGRYSQDRLTHAVNTIEDLIEIATEALEGK